MTSEDISVDVTSIEKQLAELWRDEKQNGDKPVTRAALWNVVAHTWTGVEQARATELLARASASVPQRTIVIRAEPAGSDSIASWISANCHLIGGGGEEVCSEEIAIVASGDRVDHVAPLVRALLLPDMPVAVWWIGDLPDEYQGYVEGLLEPADRLIVDSASFSGASDLDLVRRIVDETITAPADLNWARIEEWRVATATMFDPPAMRARLGSVATIRVTSGGGTSFGALSEAILYVAWFCVQSGTSPSFDFVRLGDEEGINAIELHFSDDAIAMMRAERDHGVVVSDSDGSETAVASLTRTMPRDPSDLIVRLLKQPQSDRIYLKALAEATKIARQIR